MPNQKDLQEAHNAFASPTKLGLRYTSPKSPLKRTAQPSAAQSYVGSYATTSTGGTTSSSPGLSRADLAAAIHDADSALAGVHSSPDKQKAPNYAKETIDGASRLVVSSVPKDGARSIASSKSSNSRKELDLQHNDNAFHVVANIVLEKFQSKMTPGDTFLTLDETDIAHLDQMVPHSVRLSFVEAVRYRLEHNCPPNSDLNIHALTRECGDMGLARLGNDNPLLATLNAAGMKAITIAIPPLDKARTDNSTLPDVQRIPSFQNTSVSTGARSSPGRSRIPPAYPGTHSSLLPINVPPTPGDASIGGSTITANSMTEAHVSTTESLARQQLMAELREASNLMAESVTPEAATFWRHHVVDLQARLRALHGEVGGDASRQQPEPYDQTPEAYINDPVYEPAFPVTQPVYQPSFNEMSPKSFKEGSPPSYKQTHSEPIYQMPLEKKYELPVTPTPTPAPVRKVEERKKDGPRGLPMVDVIAPADLPAGYQFEAEIQGRRFLAMVPSSAVKKGETFSCLMRDLETVAPGVPVGRWRDRLCDCSNLGLFHALSLNALFCPLLALGQIMTRHNLDFLGRPLQVRKTTSAWCTMWSILIFAAIMNGLIYFAYCYKWSLNVPLSFADIGASIILNACLFGFAIYSTSSVRASLRDKYMIREHRCFDLEDCVCATFCLPCSICQMGRHTVNYDEVNYACCNATGLNTDHPILTQSSSGYII